MRHFSRCAIQQRLPWQTVLLVADRNFVEHSFDPKQWRNPEKEEVKRQFRAQNGNRHPSPGIPLDSENVFYKEREAVERELLRNDKFTDWKVIYISGGLTALLLIFLNTVGYWVKPVPSPEYEPYVPPSTPFHAGPQGKTTTGGTTPNNAKEGEEASSSIIYSQRETGDRSIVLEKKIQALKRSS